jgi:hypothetical protein
MSGYVEVGYDDPEKRVVSVPIDKSLTLGLFLSLGGLF